MTYRYMRVIVLFDLPVTTSENIRQYSKFRKFLLKSGFIMMQESVYCKLVLNATIANAVIALVRRNKPPEGVVQAFLLTEKQFSKIEIITGEYKTDTLDSDERLIIL